MLIGAFAATAVARAGVFENLGTAEEAYIYAFPMIAAYKAMYQFNIDKTSDQYKTGFNQIWNDSHVFTPKDTAIVTPNSDGVRVHSGTDPPGETTFDPWLDDPFPDYDTEPVAAFSAS